MKDGYALVEGEVVLCVDELTVNTLVRFIDEVDAEIVGIGCAFKGSVEGTVIFAG